jgi:hypothetical protein
MSSVIEDTYKDITQYILKNRNRGRVAQLSGLHINTVSDIVGGRRDNCNLKTLIKLETAVNIIKEATKKKEAGRWMYTGKVVLREDARGSRYGEAS